MNPDQDLTDSPDPEPWLRRFAEELAADDAYEEQTWGGIDDNLLAAYVSGVCTNDEKAKVEKAMLKYPAVGECVVLARRVEAPRRVLPVVAALAASILAAVTIGLLAYTYWPNSRQIAFNPAPLPPEKPVHDSGPPEPPQIVSLEQQATEWLNAPPNAEKAMKLVPLIRRATYQSKGDIGPNQLGVLQRNRQSDIGMIIPHYFYLMDQTDRLNWDRIIALSDAHLPIKLVNVRIYTKDLVKGSDYVTKFSRALDDVRNRNLNVEVYAYVTCDGAGKALDIAKGEVTNWHELFGNRLQGIYFDNQPMDADGRVEYFRQLFAFTKELEPSWKIIAATDGGCDEAYLKILDDSIICYKTDVAFPEIKGWEHNYDSGRFGAVIHQADQLSDTELRRAATWFGWLYVTAKAERINNYKTLPTYLENEANVLKELNRTRRDAAPKGGDKPTGKSV